MSQPVLDRAALVAAQPKRRFVPLAELNGGLWVRELTGTDRDAIETETIAAREKGQPLPENFRAKVVTRALITPEGQRIFANDEHDVVGALPASVLAALYVAAADLAGIGAAAIADAEKNSAATDGAAASSA